MVVVTAEFDRFATQIATHHGHPSLRKLVLPYPLEGLPEQELLQIATDAYPTLRDLIGAAS
ncbi:MAG: hypothetical protein F2754_04260 [Actinobacteria bacterium]|uniref:Unannotated protein n=1 Tax=freshwater metagenome TaxID=449393 RepID=A0A6J6ZR89_9ZZZZ|nr:hypothetical protein [Actinomycetota bacterium]MSW91399.1 hypothetical protein [Actinomycetota bacterium]MSX86580.1 hypothetical protein [Actinomycetota bacterium]MSY72287.1 hypothetical protein [Actinomycetota bacterium]